MTHGRDCPDRCSLCCGAVPHTVSLSAGSAQLDGVPVRAGEAAASAQMTAAQRKGGRISRKRPSEGAVEVRIRKERRGRR